MKEQEMVCLLVKSKAAWKEHSWAVMRGYLMDTQVAALMEVRLVNYWGVQKEM